MVKVIVSCVDKRYVVESQKEVRIFDVLEDCLNYVSNIVSAPVVVSTADGK